MLNQFITYYSCPTAHLKITASEYSITEILFAEKVAEPMSNEVQPGVPDVLQQCVLELEEYFGGKRRVFEVPVAQQGTEFQQRVWRELMMIPFGETISYLQLAKRLGDVKAIRAAASTNGKNRIAVIVPCHRVIGSDRSLVGYAGGLNTKRWLLEHELKYARGVQSLF